MGKIRDLVGQPVIPTFTGKIVNPLELTVDDIDIRDIAHALARINRYTGHTKGKHGYNVAQHSVLVSMMCPDHRLWGLLHDASEAYLNDVARPLKYSSRIKEVYQEYELLAMGVIATKFGLKMPEPKEVKVADNVLLATEYRDLIEQTLMPEIQEKHFAFLATLPKPLVQTIKPWDAETSEEAFLHQFQLLTGEQVL